MSVEFGQHPADPVVSFSVGAVGAVGERCSFRMPAVPIHVAEFRTEAGHDKLTVNGVEYDGTGME